MHDEQIRQIVADASTFYERITASYLKSVGIDYDVQSILEQWSTELGDDEERQLLTRLYEWKGLTEAEIERGFSSVSLVDGQNIPSWASALYDILTPSEPVESNLSQFSSVENEFSLDKPIPFEEILEPFVRFFHQRLEQNQIPLRAWLTDSACQFVERSLLWTLSSYASYAFYYEFSLFRERRMSPLDQVLMALDTASDSHYSVFVSTMRQGSIVDFFLKYPVLARLLSRVTVMWIESMAEFLDRLANDLLEIRAIFFNDRETGKIEFLNPLMSDRHMNGRTVMILQFESGLKIVYKPRDIRIDYAFNQLLIWLNNVDSPFDMKTLRVLTRDGYGWVEFADATACSNREDIIRYYQRCGTLLCLVYLLEGTDCHTENVIACGEFPVLIDCETLLHPRVEVDASEDIVSSADYLAQTHLNHSVLRTGLLPHWGISVDRKAVYDMSAIGGYESQVLPFRAAVWHRVNTDDMRLTFGETEMPIGNSIPIWGEARINVETHVEAIEDGFQRTYRFLITHQKDLLDRSSPLYLFEELESRFVFRVTRIYGAIINDVRNPSILRSGINFSLILEKLARAFLIGESKPPYLPVLEVERKSMEQLDIPHFTSSVNGTDFRLHSGEVIHGYFIEPSFQTAIANFHDLDEEKLSEQLKLVRASLHTRITKHIAPRTNAKNDDVCMVTNTSSVSRARFEIETADIATELLHESFRGRDDSLTWIAPQSIVQLQRYNLETLGPNLYDGLAGIALYFSALFYIRQQAEYKDIATSIVRQIMGSIELRRRNRPPSEHIGIGGTAGVGGILYGLVKVSQLINDESILDYALQTSAHIEFADIKSYSTYDVIGGCAGAILGLLALHEATSDKQVLELANALGTHMLHARVATRTGLRVWPNTKGVFLTGFAHGAAGIAYSLGRLYRQTGISDYISAAQECIQYENNLFSSLSHNWPDLRFRGNDAIVHEESRDFAVAWCHGGPGIGLARMGYMEAVGEYDYLSDVDYAIDVTLQKLRFSVEGPDFLCCGNFGLVETLTELSRFLKNSTLANFAGTEATRLIDLARNRGSYQFSYHGRNHPIIPGFFVGTSGIGYTILRLQNPEKLPCVLLLR